MRELQGSLDASGLALEEARKAVSVKGAEYERMEAKYEAAEGEAASLRDEVALKQKEVYRLEEEMVQIGISKRKLLTWGWTLLSPLQVN